MTTQHEPILGYAALGAPPGQDLFSTPGDLQIDQGTDQSSEWIPRDAVFHWPSLQIHRQIVRRRQYLYDAMQRLEASVARASGQEDWKEVVIEALTRLDSALRTHVDEIEAPDGLFSEVIEIAPHLSWHVELLRQEHDDLVGRCRKVLDMAQGNATPKEIRRRVLGVLGLLAVHRQAPNSSSIPTISN